MSDCRDAAARSHTGKKGAVTDPGCAENDVLAIGQIVCRIYAIQILFMAFGNQAFSLLVVARLHSALHIATEAFDGSRSQYRFGRTADAHIQIDIGLR